MTEEGSRAGVRLGPRLREDILCVGWVLAKAWRSDWGSRCRFVVPVSSFLNTDRGRRSHAA